MNQAKFLFVVLLLITAFSSVACSETGFADSSQSSFINSNKPDIVFELGIIGAMDIETAHIKEKMDVFSKSTIGGRIFYEGSVEGVSVVVVTCGIGKVNAAMTTQILISLYNVKSVIMTGVAGGLGPNLKYGDLVIAEDVVQHDYTRIYDDSMEPGRIKVMKKGKGSNVKSFPCDKKLQRQLLSAAESIDFSGRTPLSGDDPTLWSGRIVSGDQFIGSSKMHQWLIEHFDPLAVDMETAAVGHVCLSFHIPFAAIRGISDLSSSTSVVHYHVNKGRGALHAQQVVLSLLYKRANSISP